jgi:DNA repair photolyase
MSIQKATGNMYPWVDYVHSYLRGACPYECPYCYVQAIARRFGNTALQGPLRFAEKELKANYGAEKYHGKTIFVEHTHDLFHPDVNPNDMLEVLIKCQKAKSTRFVFQTRNTHIASLWREDLPQGSIVGTTIETNRTIGKAPAPTERAIYLKQTRNGANRCSSFITIEPILAFDLGEMIELIEIAEPDFINIGADSKGTGLEEPTAIEVKRLIDAIQVLGIEIRTKRNLDRILKKEATCPSK